MITISTLNCDKSHVIFWFQSHKHFSFQSETDQTLKMKSCSIFLCFILFIRIIATLDHKFFETNTKITVTLSERKPFAFLNSKGKPQGLDVLIIQNFAENCNLDEEYVFVNESLNYVFSDEEYFDSPSFKKIISR